MASGYPFAALSRALARPEPPQPARRPRHRAARGETTEKAALTSPSVAGERPSRRHRGLRLASLLHRHPARTPS